jgi:serine palmitoyltransferase
MIFCLLIILPAELNHFLCDHSDEGVHWAVQNGLHLSRSTVVYFKHNDMASLASTLDKLTRGNKRTEKIRRYIVVESIYQV